MIDLIKHFTIKLWKLSGVDEICETTKRFAVANNQSVGHFVKVGMIGHPTTEAR